jgi:hypothetical protein
MDQSRAAPTCELAAGKLEGWVDCERRGSWRLGNLFEATLLGPIMMSVPVSETLYGSVGN